MIITSSFFNQQLLRRSGDVLVAKWVRLWRHRARRTRSRMIVIRSLAAAAAATGVIKIITTIINSRVASGVTLNVQVYWARSDLLPGPCVSTSTKSSCATERQDIVPVVRCSVNRCHEVYCCDKHNNKKCYSDYYILFLNSAMLLLEQFFSDLRVLETGE